MSQTLRTVLPSTPSNPAELRREIAGLDFTLTGDGLTIAGLPGAPIELDTPTTLALSDFLRSPGARTLINRAWLAEQHAAVVTGEA